MVHVWVRTDKCLRRGISVRIGNEQRLADESESGHLSFLVIERPVRVFAISVLLGSSGAA